MQAVVKAAMDKQMEEVGKAAAAAPTPIPAAAPVAENKNEDEGEGPDEGAAPQIDVVSKDVVPESRLKQEVNREVTELILLPLTRSIHSLHFTFDVICKCHFLVLTQSVFLQLKTTSCVSVGSRRCSRSSLQRSLGLVPWYYHECVQGSQKRGAL
jgi:hypothetical protein